MAFQPGNKHAAKGKAFDAALRRAIAQDDADRLRKAAESLLTAAADGAPWALGMLADRLDGKSPQSLTVEHKSLREMSLDELQSAIAEALAGGDKAQGSADQPGPVH